MPVKLANNAAGRLAMNITTTTTAITLQAGNGAAFPTPSGGDWFPMTLYRADASLEIVRVTARSGDVLTVVRGQEGTAPKSFSLGDRAELRLTSGALDQLLSDLKATLAAAGIAFTPITGLSATNVQAAIAELNTEKQPAGSYAAASHTHDWAQVTGKPATYPPTIGATATTAKAGNYVPAWAEVTGKPTTFTPAAHNQAWGTITDVPVYATRWPTFSEMSGSLLASQLPPATAGMTFTLTETSIEYTAAAQSGWTTMLTYICGSPGTVTIYFTQKRTLNSNTIDARVLKNGVEQQLWSTSSTSAQVRQLDLAVELGDEIKVQHRSPKSATNSVVNNLGIYSGVPCLFGKVT